MDKNEYQCMWKVTARVPLKELPAEFPQQRLFPPFASCLTWPTSYKCSLFCRVCNSEKDRESGTPGMGHGGGHGQMQHAQQQPMMQMPPMGAFAGQPFAPGPGPMMGQPMMQMHQQMQQGGMPQAST